MINIFFVPGMFGSTIEYMLRNYTKDYESVIGNITDDGSLHTFSKEFHPSESSHLLTFSPDIKISTPIYPFPDMDLNEILVNWPGDLHTSKNIFIHAKDSNSAELNMLFQYYKISKGVLNFGIGIFCGENKHNIVNWNNSYTHWSQMQTWEIREWLSLFYSPWVNKWMNIDRDVDQVPNKLIISNLDILKNLKEQFNKIIKFCNLVPTGDVREFINEWSQKQQYIVDEFELINKIIACTLSNKMFEWDSNGICLLSESIIQKRLRDKGYELKCFDLNTFPNNSKALYNILEKV